MRDKGSSSSLPERVCVCVHVVSIYKERTNVIERVGQTLSVDRLAEMPDEIRKEKEEKNEMHPELYL